MDEKPKTREELEEEFSNLISGNSSMGAKNQDKDKGLFDKLDELDAKKAKEKEGLLVEDEWGLEGDFSESESYPKDSNIFSKKEEDFNPHIKTASNGDAESPAKLDNSIEKKKEDMTLEERADAMEEMMRKRLEEEEEEEEEELDEEA